MKINEYFYRLVGRDSFVTKRHFHNEIEIIEVVRGNGIIISNGNSYELKSNYLYYIDARKPHIVNPFKVDEYIRNKIVIDADSFFEFFDGIGLSKTVERLLTAPPVYVGESRQIDLLFKKVNELCSAGLRGRGFAHAYIIELIYLTGDIQPKPDFPNNDIIQKILSVINNENGLISLEELADRLSYSKYYICHIFKEKTGVSLSHYIDEKRNELCIRELTQTKLPISVIAENCGFSEASSFTRFFKEKNGISPLKYRNHHIQSDKAILQSTKSGGDYHACFTRSQ